MKLLQILDYKRKWDYPLPYNGEDATLTVVISGSEFGHEFDLRIARIQSSLYRINQLMQQLKRAAEQAEQNQND